MILQFVQKPAIKGFGGITPENKLARLGHQLAVAGSIPKNLTTGRVPIGRVDMSIALMQAVKPLDLPTNEKFVLFMLADHAKDDGICWPSVGLLARECSLSRREVQKCLRSLQKRLLIEENRRHGHSTKFTVKVGSVHCSPCPLDAMPNGRLPASNGHPQGRPIDTQNLNLESPIILGEEISENEKEKAVDAETQRMLDNLYRGGKCA